MTHDAPVTEAPDDAPRPGPQPERLKIEGFDDWEDAVRAGLKKAPPSGGWPSAPETQPKPRTKKKGA